jgi:hypothetical protein
MSLRNPWMGRLVVAAGIATLAPVSLGAAGQLSLFLEDGYTQEKGGITEQGASAVLLVLDADAIAVGQPPNSFAETDINKDVADVGLRDRLPYFVRHVGDQIMLPGGQAGHEGWFALTSVPDTWQSAQGAGDGPQRFVLAGSGLGSPDVNDDRQSLLDNVAGVTPLRASGLQTLIGRHVCGVVYAAKISWTQDASGTSLRGATLGLVAFSVAAVGGGDAAEPPSVEIEILDAAQTCSGALTLMSDAPNPSSGLSHD